MELVDSLSAGRSLGGYLFFAAAIQGFFLAAALSFHPQNRLANRVLAVWVALLSFDLLSNFIFSAKLYEAYPKVSLFVVLLPATYGPFLFLYVRSLIQGRALRAQDALHFSGYLVMVMIALPFVGKSPYQLNDSLFVGQATLTKQFILSVMNGVATLYALVVLVVLSNYRKQPNAFPHLGWLQALLVLNLIVWIVVWFSWLLPSYFSVDCNVIIYSLVSLFIYVLGYFSLRQPAVFNGISAIRDTNELNGIDSDHRSQALKDASKKYGDARLPYELREHIFIAIEDCMKKDEVWRQTNLTLSQLANLTGLSSHQVSQVLNDHRGQSFNDYLNQFRVEAVCKLLRESCEENMLDLALACGFSSKSSFNAIFKKQTQQTPSEYRKLHQNKIGFKTN